MLDLSKSYGRFEGIPFFGDHHDETIIYYLPDEIKLSPKTSRENEYEFSLQLFHENKMMNSSSTYLEDTEGSILQLSVNCMVTPERLQRAFTKLKENVKSIPSNATLTTPLWTDGSTNLITLDRTSFDENSDSDMVKAIVSSQRPSFAQDLKSIFNVKYDRRGTELINSAIKNSQGMIAVDYDLQFAAIRPAFDLKISAYLSRCQETARKNIDANLKLTYEEFQVDLSTHFEWLTQKMVENGDIKIEVTNQLTSEEDIRQVDKLVDEFKDTVMRHLFRPTTLNGSVSPLNDELIKFADIATPIKVGFCYTLSNLTISEDRILSVDYTERAAIIQHHNPKALLLENSEEIAAHYDDYVKHVVIGELWNSQSVDVELFHDFDDPDNDLTSAEVIVWKHKDGVLEDVSENNFAIPAQTKPLGNFIFSPNEETKKFNISWPCDENDDGGYYYQFRFIYSGNTENRCSPLEIVTPPVLSFNRSLSIAPNSYMYFRKISIMTGSVDFSVFDKVEVSIDVEDCNGEALATNQRFILNAQCEQIDYIVRGKDKSDLKILVSKVFYYKKKSEPPLKFPQALLNDYAVIVDDPLIEKDICPTILGDTEDVKKIVLSFTITSPVVSRPVTKTITLNNFDEDPFSITIYTPDDLISYEITKVYKDADGKYQKKTTAKEQIIASELDMLYIDLDAELTSEP